MTDRFAGDDGGRGVARSRAPTGRKCGDCSLCCRLFEIPELNKPKDAWCGHCRPGKGGCAIHQERPQVCRNFDCQWLVDPELGDEWYPKRAKIVVHWQKDAEAGYVLDFAVDPQYPNRWREQPYESYIARRSLHALRSGMYKVQVSVGRKYYDLNAGQAKNQLSQNR